MELVDYDWIDDYDKFVKIDYSKYKQIEDLTLTPDQHIIFYKLDKVKNEFLTSQRQKQEKRAKTLPPIMGIDLSKVSPTVKLLYTFVVFALFIVGILYGLSKTKKNTNQEKKKRN